MLPNRFFQLRAERSRRGCAIFSNGETFPFQVHNRYFEISSVSGKVAFREITFHIYRHLIERVSTSIDVKITKSRWPRSPRIHTILQKMSGNHIRKIFVCGPWTSPREYVRMSRFVSEWRSFPIRKWSRYEILAVTARFLETVTRALIAWTRFSPSLFCFSFFQRKLTLVLVRACFFSFPPKKVPPRENIWRLTRGLYNQRFNFQTLSAKSS